jgi:hypothetical protein
VAKDKVNKSQLVRELIEKNSKITANDAVEAMKSKGHEITAGLFYAIKNKVSGGSGKRKGKKADVATVPLDALKEVRAVADRVGGMDALIEVAKALK